MLALNELVAANERAFRAARAAARSPIQNEGRFRIVAVPGSQRLLVFRKSPPPIRIQRSNYLGALVDAAPGDSERALADAISAAPVLRITLAFDGNGHGLRAARFDVEREHGFQRWRGYGLAYSVCIGMAKAHGISKEVYDGCFTRVTTAALS